MAAGACPKVAGFVLGLMAAVAASTAAGAESLHGQGWGESRDRACRQALAALAESLQVEVKSSFRVEQQSSREGDGEREVDTTTEQDIRTRSDLPILGARQSAERRDGQFVCTARLDPERARRYYRERLAGLRQQAADVETELRGAAGDEARYRLLNELLTVVDRYARFGLVARYLGLEVPPASERSATGLREELAGIEDEAPSVRVAANRLTRDLPDAVVHLTPPHPVRSREVTPFARAIERAMAGQLRTTGDPEQAEFRLRGEYEVNDSGLVVTYRLTDRKDVTREMRTVTLNPGAYDHLRVEPRTADFDRLLHEGLAVDSGFRVSLATHQGQEDLLFRSGQDVELLIKLNQPGYYYLTGHTVRDGESYSYLVPLQDARGARRFVRYMNAEQANKWVSLGAFEVTPPFGVESLQVIASSRDLVSSVPGYEFDRSSGLYMVAEDAAEGVSKTRALKPKTENEVRSAESVLMFTTTSARTPD